VHNLSLTEHEIKVFGDSMIGADKYDDKCVTTVMTGYDCYSEATSFASECRGQHKYAQLTTAHVFLFPVSVARFPI
jgi:hypothetical protein